MVRRCHLCDIFWGSPSTGIHHLSPGRLTATWWRLAPERYEPGGLGTNHHLPTRSAAKTNYSNSSSPHFLCADKSKAADNRAKFHPWRFVTSIHFVTQAKDNPDSVDDASDGDDTLPLSSVRSFTCGLCSELCDSYDSVIAHHSEKHPAYYPGKKSLSWPHCDLCTLRLCVHSYSNCFSPQDIADSAASFKTGRINCWSIWPSMISLT